MTPPGSGFKYHAGTKQLRAAGRNGGRSTHGESIIYIDGRPYSLQRLSKEHGLTVERLARRCKEWRERGKSITLDDLVKPLRKQRKPAPPTSTERLRRLLR